VNGITLFHVQVVAIEITRFGQKLPVGDGNGSRRAARD
jgi:hypothetical protein